MLEPEEKVATLYIPAMVRQTDIELAVKLEGLLNAGQAHIELDYSKDRGGKPVIIGISLCAGPGDNHA